VPAACDALIRQKSLLIPDANDAAAYAKYYNIYRGLYSHLKNDYAVLAQL
jgi:sugar (pentulose or hexulose) kinase